MISLSLFIISDPYLLPGISKCFLKNVLFCLSLFLICEKKKPITGCDISEFLSRYQKQNINTSSSFLSHKMMCEKIRNVLAERINKKRCFNFIIFAYNTCSNLSLRSVKKPESGSFELPSNSKVYFQSFDELFFITFNFLVKLKSLFFSQ